MKKRLEADLISIAHRILQLKDKSDINQLYLETQKLYEKLSVLKFVEENYGDVKPTIGNYSGIEKEVESFYDKNAVLPIETEIEMTESNMFQDTNVEEQVEESKEETENIVVPEIVTEDEIIIAEEIENEEELVSEEETEVEENTTDFHESEPEIEDNTVTEEESKAETVTEEIPEFKAAFELSEEPEAVQAEVKKPETVQISFEDLLGLSYSEPEFIKVDEVPAIPTKEIVFETPETPKIPIEKEVEKTEKTDSKPVSLNDKFSKGIEIDLNDRIAFVKHLFGNSNEDYIRVMNQLITFDNFYETKSFIDDMVKPDYNNWQGKEEYEERFMEIIEKKFL